MVARVAQLCPGAVLTKLDKLVEPLKQTVTTKVKANAVKQEYEKQDELKRSAMRAVAALMHVPGAGKLFVKLIWRKKSAICLYLYFQQLIVNYFQINILNWMSFWPKLKILPIWLIFSNPFKKTTPTESMRLDIPRLVWLWILAEGKAAVKQVIFFREFDLQFIVLLTFLLLSSRARWGHQSHHHGI